jgi:hypothetical protein
LFFNGLGLRSDEKRAGGAACGGWGRIIFRAKKWAFGVFSTSKLLVNHRFTLKSRVFATPATPKKERGTP